MTTSKAAGNAAKLNNIVDASDPYFGAGPSKSSAINAAAIQDALDTGYDVRLGKGTFEFDTGLMIKGEGQILLGQGMGDNSVGGQTILKYTGVANAVMLSFYDGAKHYQNAGVENIILNGNALANRGIELYNDALAGGAWRQFLRNVFIYGVSNGVTPTAIYAGAGTGADNANEFLLDHVIMWGSAYGLVTGGAMGTLMGRCATKLCTSAGVRQTPGSAIFLGDTTFSDNAWDILASNAQLTSAAGAWFENSGLPATYGANGGIYKTDTAHNLSLTGCYLHTSNTTQMMDFGAAAGYHSLNGNYLGSTTASESIINVNSTATGIITGQGLSPSFVTTGRAAPLYMPKKQTGNAGTWCANATMTNAQTLELSLGRGCFIVNVDVFRTAAANNRTQTSYTAFLFDGDSETVTQIATDNGSAGGEGFTLAATNNSVTLTYTGANTVEAYISATGVIG